jgi:hypothetical protein
MKIIELSLPELPPALSSGIFLVLIEFSICLVMKLIYVSNMRI